MVSGCQSGSTAGPADGPPNQTPSAGAGGTDGPPGSTPPDMPPGTVVPVDGCDMPAILSKAANGCANGGCHGDRPQGGIDLVSTGVEQRLVGVRSTTSACSGRLLVDPAKPDSSLLLQVIDPARFAGEDHCGVMMPFGSKTGVSAEDLTCFEQWVDKMAKEIEVTNPDPVVFQPVSVESYTNKVKTLLTGGAVSAAELAAVSADPKALDGLVATWLEQPAFMSKMSVFLANALQQRTTGGFATQFNALQGQAWGKTLAANLEESFTRTALNIVQQGQPFTNVMTTQRWQATTATLVGLSYLDHTDAQLRAEKHRIASTRTADMPALPLPLSYSVQNHSWVYPSIPADCTPAPNQDLLNVLDMLIGGIHCGPGKTFQLAKDATALTQADFEDWRDVTLSSGPAANPPEFYDLDALRAAKTLRLKQPRVGFFTTPAFLANWDTNDDNQFRVTTSQTVITALGEIFSPADQTPTLREDGLNEDHAAPGSTCYGCHQFIDPMRLYFAKSLSTRYQLTEKPMAGTPSFAFAGASHDGGDLYTLATTLRDHPHFAAAWVQKLCYYANSQACDEKDPEFQRVVSAFVSSKYDFKSLVRTLFTSPLVTGATSTQTYENQANLVSITRSEHLCQLLDTRLGTSDACGLAASFANLIPDDGFSRGSAVPIQPAVTSLFHFSAAEKLCDKVASRLVGTTATAVINPSNPEAAFDTLTQSLMGLGPSHSRYATARQALSDHFTAAKGTGASPTIAMRSVFTLACLSPDVMALGL